MSDDVSCLINLLDQEPDAPWSEDLRTVLLSKDLKKNPGNPQQCTAHFALKQAQRRLESSRVLEKTTFGIESLISELSKLNGDERLDYYIISTPTHLGTCYVFQGRLLGCEFVLKSGSETKPGLWVDGKQIT
ncbi:hypothetical protein [Burkholderia stagnalis]|uniref:hypothetical protein n=1 Tax=Burkholderia stagnalis TaxID=1503054 RepID=UPI000A7AAFFD|nr:hypothetical protein [Burkholderia stagnalis]